MAPTGADVTQRNWVEIVSTVLLALAVVATAWSSHQATRWNGEQVKASSRANALRIEAARSAGLAQSQTEVDIATFNPMGSTPPPATTTCSPSSTSSGSAPSSAPGSTRGWRRSP